MLYIIFPRFSVVKALKDKNTSFIKTQHLFYNSLFRFFPSMFFCASLLVDVVILVLMQSYTLNYVGQMLLESGHYAADEVKEKLGILAEEKTQLLELWEERRIR